MGNMTSCGPNALLHGILPAPRYSPGQTLEVPPHVPGILHCLLRRCSNKQQATSSKQQAASSTQHSNMAGRGRWDWGQNGQKNGQN